MKRKEKKEERERRSLRVRIKKTVVFLLCLELVSSNMPSAYAGTPAGPMEYCKNKDGVMTYGSFMAESADNAARPGGDSAADDKGPGLAEGEISDEMADKGEEDCEKGTDEEENGEQYEESDWERTGEDGDSEKCGSGIFTRAISVEIFEDFTYETLLHDGTDITLSGRMPEEVSARAYPVDVDVEGITILASYDISVFDAEGNIWQPSEDGIEVTIDNAEIRDALAGEREITVFHLDEEIDEAEEISVSPSKFRSVRFPAKHFSIYIVGDTGLTDIGGQKITDYVFNFYGYPDDTAESMSGCCAAQTVTSGEYLNEPALPEVAHHVFKGWYSEPCGKGMKFEFDETVGANLQKWGYDSERDAAVTVSLYAYYCPVYHVYFMTEEDNGGSSVFYTEEYNENSPILRTEKATELYQKAYGANESGRYYAVTGWYCNDNGEKVTAAEGSIISEDMTLFPEVEAVIWVYFDMNGADTSKVDLPAPVYLLPGENVSIGDALPNDPVRDGYKFNGWCTENGDPVSPDTAVDSIEKTDGNIILYACWEETTAGYTVNIWRQRAESSLKAKENDFTNYAAEYDIAETIYVTADGEYKNAAVMTGTPIRDICETDEWREWTGYALDPAQDSHYLGFEYNEARTLAEIGYDDGIKDRDGSGIRPEEFGMDHIKATVAGDGSTAVNIYYDRVTITWNFYGILYEDRLTYEGKPVRQLAGLYGADIPAGDWPSTEEYGEYCIWCYEDTSYRFDTSYKYLYPNGSTEPMKDVDFYLRRIDMPGGTLLVYREVLPGADDTRMVTVNVGGVTKYYEYFTHGVLRADAPYGISEKFSTHHASGYIDSSQDKLGFQAVNTDNGLYKPEIPENGDRNRKVILYYDLNSYDLTFYSNGETLKKVTYKYTETIDFPDEEEIMASLAQNPDIRPAPHYIFSGWALFDGAEESSRLYETMPGRDLVYYAVWKPQNITITFDPGISDGSVTGIPESAEIPAGSAAPDLDAPMRDGYDFIGWETDDGGLFNSTTLLYDDTHLTAVWKEKDPKECTLTYAINLKDHEKTYTYTCPETFYEGAAAGLAAIGEVIEKMTDTEFSVEETEVICGKFVCWNENIEGSGRDYYPGSQYNFRHGNGVVYAKFAKEKEAVLHLHLNYPEGYRPGPDAAPEEILITTSNLDEMDLSDLSGLNEGDTIETDTDVFRFEGWSTFPEACSRDDVEIGGDRKISANGADNSLYAVWERAAVQYIPLEPADQIFLPAEDVWPPSDVILPGEMENTEDADDTCTGNKGTPHYISLGGGHKGSSPTVLPGENTGYEEISGDREYSVLKETSQKAEGRSVEPWNREEITSDGEELPFTGDAGSDMPLFLYLAGMYIIIFLQLTEIRSFRSGHHK